MLRYRLHKFAKYVQVYYLVARLAILGVLCGELQPTNSTSELGPRMAVESQISSEVRDGNVVGKKRFLKSTSQMRWLDFSVF